MEEIKQLLNDYLRRNNIKLLSSQIDQIICYIQLLLKWNKIYNLTNITKPQDILTRHIFESLDLLPYIKTKMKVIDVGTGAGIPGLVLAIVCPCAEFFLCEIVEKKITFLRQAIIELGLTNCKVIDQRIENYTPGFAFDIIMSKAFAALDKFLLVTKHLSNEKTIFLTFKAQNLSPEELLKISAEFVIDAIINQEVEQKDHIRKLVILRKIR